MRGPGLQRRRALEQGDRLEAEARRPVAPIRSLRIGPGPLSEGLIRPVRRVPRNPNAASCRRAKAETISPRA